MVSTYPLISCSNSSQSQMPKHAPYPPTVAGLGGRPTITLDDPIVAVFLVLFVIGAAMHMTILQVNLRRGKKFIMSGMLFGFCMARITACTMRLIWSTHPTDISVAIAAQIFVAAGVLLLFIVNLIFSQRILRACHPGFAWTTWFSTVFKVYYATIVIMIIALITCTVQSFYTLNTNTRRIDRDVQRVGVVYFTISAFLPFPLMALNYLLPYNTRIDKFGEGRFRSKIAIVLFTSFILTLGAAFRAGISFVPRPASNPAWYHSKACFYIFNFTIEIVVVYLFAFIRVDKRFHVPNGARAVGNYKGNGIIAIKDEPMSPTVMGRVNTEEEFFDGEDEGELRTENELADRRPREDRPHLDYNRPQSYVREMV